MPMCIKVVLVYLYVLFYLNVSNSVLILSRGTECYIRIRCYLGNSISYRKGSPNDLSLVECKKSLTKHCKTKLLYAALLLESEINNPDVTFWTFLFYRMKCPKCNHIAVEETAKYCSQCGTVLTSQLSEKPQSRF